MAGTVTEDGTEVFAELGSGATSSGVEAVALGEGTSDVSETDQSMESEVHREAPETITKTGNGEREYSITVTGGTEVPAGTDVSEFGLFDTTTADSGRMIYHEVEDPITVNDGVSQEFIVTLNLDIGT